MAIRGGRFCAACTANGTASVDHKMLVARQARSNAFMCKPAPSGSYDGILSNARSAYKQPSPNAEQIRTLETENALGGMS